MELITSFYYPPNLRRLNELKETIKNNIKKDFIEKINLIITEKDLTIFQKEIFLDNNYTNKLNIIIYNNKPTYKYLIELIKNINNKIVCICNSDIEFFLSSNEIFKNLNDFNCFFLTRHEDHNNKPLIDKYLGSHDAFIMHSDILKDKIKNIDLTYIDYPQNTPGIEALLIIFFIEKLNYVIFNPCFDIKLIHHHKSNFKTYTHKDIVGHVYPNHPLGGMYKNTIWCKYLIYPCKNII
tara:strand:+ start:192 stop:905 length:714 start_codon:yes stop_codon:yes gene_type:complete